ncbi:MAG: DASS family sodium-coupled anion symporter [Thermoplasmata archaeon]
MKQKEGSNLGKEEPWLNKKRVIVFILAVILFFLPQILNINGLDGNMSAALGILLVAALFWITEVIPLYATSLVIVLLQIMSISEDAVTVNEALAPFFNHIIALFFGGFILAAALQRYNVDIKLAKEMLKRFGKSPRGVLLGLMGVTAFLSMWMSNTATTALMVALAIPIYTQIPKEEKFTKAMMLGIPFAANIGGMATPIGTPPNAIIINELAIARPGYASINITFLEWMVIAIPLTLIMLLFTYLLLYYSYKPSVKKLNINLEHSDLRGFSKKQLFVLFIFGITVLLWLTSSVSTVDNLFRSAGIIALIPAVIFFSTGLLDKDDLAKLNWNVLLLMGGGLSLGNAIDSTGLADWIVSLIDHQALGVILVIVVFVAIAIVLSTFMSNTATAAVMAPIMIIVGMDLGATVSIMAAIAFSCSMAMALPVSTPPNAIAYGQDVIDMKDMIINGVIVGIFGIIMLTLLFGIF